jgi:hypothetical protein
MTGHGAIRQFELQPVGGGVFMRTCRLCAVSRGAAMEKGGRVGDESAYLTRMVQMLPVVSEYS